MIAAVNVDELGGFWLFSSLSRDELERVARWTDEVEVETGHVLAEQGEIAHQFFLIEDGAAEVVKDGERIAELGAGDFFGEIGLLETERRTASVIATRPLKALVMFQREFKQMEREMPAVAARVRAAIRARLGN
jgi:cAMP-dependent protein kinase regulator